MLNIVYSNLISSCIRIR